MWTYAILNLFHILGLSLLFGAIMLLDLRMLGLWRSIPLAGISRPAVPLAGLGFALALGSGICMLAVNATEYDGNPFMFYVKFPAIGLGVLNIVVLAQVPAWKEKDRRELSAREQGQLAVFGGISLLSWVTAIVGGRMIGYW